MPRLNLNCTVCRESISFCLRSSQRYLSPRRRTAAPPLVSALAFSAFRLAFQTFCFDSDCAFFKLGPENVAVVSPLSGPFTAAMPTTLDIRPSQHVHELLISDPPTNTRVLPSPA
jgi:hypothetical protein